MTGGGYAVGGGVWEKDDGRGTFVLVEEARLDSVQGVRGGDGAWVSGITHADTEWDGREGEKALERHAPR